jgi:hypothetical protein
MAGPLIQRDPQGNPHILSYDLPEPTSYRGRYVMELDFPDAQLTKEKAAPTSPPAPDVRRALPGPSRPHARYGAAR